MRKVPTILTLCIAGVLAAGDDGPVSAPGPAPKETRAAYPHAGISLTVPPGFALHAPAEPFGLLYAMHADKNEPTSLTLAAVPVSDEATLEKVADEFLADLKRDLAFKDVTCRRRVPMKLGDLDGLAEALSYTCRGDQLASARLLTIRSAKGTDGAARRFCYVLGVEGLPGDSARLPDLLGQVVDTVKLTEPKSPGELPLGDPMPAVGEPRLGYALRPLSGWHIARRYGGVVLAQRDYRRGVDATLQIDVETMPADLTACGCIDQSLQDAAQQAGGAEYTTLERKDMVQGEWPSHQCVVRPEAPTTRPAKNDDAESPKRPARMLIVHRTVCGPRLTPNTRRVYSVVLVYPDSDVERAKAIMERHAKGLTIEGPAGMPATKGDAGG